MSPAAQSLEALIILQVYGVLSHGAASLGKNRPQNQRTRFTNTVGTLLDLATYVATFLYLYSTVWFQFKNLILGIVAIGALAHFVYVLFQIPDRWYRHWIDDYTKTTISHGPLLRSKITAATLDTLFHATGFAATLVYANITSYSLLACGCLAYLLFNNAWLHPKES